ncbi:MAG: hypothetical protein ACK4ND_01810 [Cytophagaceae bacterium]
MNINLKKIAVVLAIYYSVIFLQACCRCKQPLFQYQEYKALRIKPSEILSPQISFDVTADSIYYLNYSTPCNVEWGVINSTYACSCKEEGHKGAKYKITAVNIYADSIYDPSVPASQPLTSLFEVVQYQDSQTGEYHTVPIDDVGFYFYNIDRQMVIITTKVKPVAPERAYRFMVEIKKDNGSVARATSAPIRWGQLYPG